MPSGRFVGNDILHKFPLPERFPLAHASTPMKLPMLLLIALAGLPGMSAAAGDLFRDWLVQPPSVRTPLIERAAASAGGARELLAAIETGLVAAVEVPAGARKKLATNHGNEIAKRAAALLTASSSPDRKEVLAAYEPALQRQGNAGRGASVYGRTCGSCHKFKGRGPDIAPDLAMIPDRSTAYLAQSILDPNAVILPQNIYYLVDTKDFRSVSGLVKRDEAGELTLAAPGGGDRVTVKLAEVDEIRASKLSLMPEGLEKLVPPADLPDLIAFLQQ